MAGTNIARRVVSGRRGRRGLALSVAVLLVVCVLGAQLPVSGRAMENAEGMSSGWDGELALAPVTLGFAPGAKTVVLNDTFWVSVDLNTDGQQVDGAQVYVDYDPTYLTALDVWNGPTLNSWIKADWSVPGQVDYAAGMTSGSASGYFTVCRIQFRAITLTAGTQITFHNADPRIIKVKLGTDTYPANCSATSNVVIIEGGGPVGTTTPPVSEPGCRRNGESDYEGATDTYLYNGAPTTNYGAEAGLHLLGSIQKVTLIRFDVSDIPTDAIVTEASLDLRTTLYQQGTISMDVDFYRLRRPWVESEATWMVAATGDPWAAPGAAASLGPDPDRDPAPFTSMTIGSTDTWYVVELTNIVQGWVSNPEGNFGVLLEPVGVGHGFRFWSSDYDNAIVYRPRLCVDFIQPTPTATPTETATVTPEPTVPSPTPTWTAMPTATSTGTPTETPTLGPKGLLFLPLIMQ